MPEPQATQEWGKPLPRYLPPSSFWPLGVAIAAMFLLWAPAFTYVVPWVIVPTGLGLMLVSVGGWIKAIREDWRHKDG